MITLSGVLEFLDIGPGSWLFKVDDVVYELLDHDLQSAKPGDQVTFKGIVSPPGYSFTMSGKPQFKVMKD